MEAITEVLPQHPFFAGLSRQDIQRVAAWGNTRTIAGGTALFYAGDPADTFYVVLRGRIDMRVHRRVGRSQLIDSVTGGDVVGWSWLVEPHRWMFDAVAVQDTELFAIDGIRLRHACDEDLAFGYAFMTRVTRMMHLRLDACRKQLASRPHGGGDGCC